LELVVIHNHVGSRDAICACLSASLSCTHRLSNTSPACAAAASYHEHPDPPCALDV
jgi:hypothetical protein